MTKHPEHISVIIQRFFEIYNPQHISVSMKKTASFDQKSMETIELAFEQSEFWSSQSNEAYLPGLGKVTIGPKTKPRQQVEAEKRLKKDDSERHFF